MNRSPRNCYCIFTFILVLLATSTTWSQAVDKRQAITAGQPPAATVDQDQLEALPQSRGLYQILDDAKHPADGWTMGGDVRLREVYFNNAILLNDKAVGHENHFQRYRLRWWNSVTPVEDVELNVRLMWEFWHWNRPTEDTGFVYDSSREGPIYIDNLYLKLAHPFDLPAVVSLGRQDIILGEGWLVIEGTPADLDRTIFFDAVRATWDLPQWHSTLDTIYIDQAGPNDDRLGTINDLEEDLIEQDERGAIIYLSNQGIPDSTVDAYFIYKHMEALPGTARRTMGLNILSAGDNGDIHTLGGRFAHEMDENWSFSLEGAKQFGRKNGATLNAFGLNGRIVYAFNDPAKSAIHLGYEYLSGNDPATAQDEAFDILWGRWARYSELIGYAYFGEERGAEFTNMHRLQLGYHFSPADALEVCFDYHVLFADENTYAGASGFSDTGAVRGHLLTALARYRFDEHWSAHLLGELFQPSSYYDSTRNDLASFVRGELMFVW